MMTPFSQENFTAILNDAKPFRNVIKRYWTEEEVILMVMLTHVG